MSKVFCVAKDKESGEKGEFVAGPFETLMQLAMSLADDELPVFVVEDGKPPRFVDLNSSDTIIL